MTESRLEGHYRRMGMNALEYNGKSLEQWFEGLLKTPETVPQELVDFFGQRALPYLIARLLVQAHAQPHIHDWEFALEPTKAEKKVLREMLHYVESSEGRRRTAQQTLIATWLEGMGERALPVVPALVSYSARTGASLSQFVAVFAAIGPKSIPAMLKTALKAATELTVGKELFTADPVDSWEYDLLAVFRALHAKYGEPVKVQLRRLALVEDSHGTAWWASKLLLLLKAKSAGGTDEKRDHLAIGEEIEEDTDPTRYHGLTVEEWFDAACEELGQPLSDVVKYFGVSAIPFLASVLDQTPGDGAFSSVGSGSAVPESAEERAENEEKALQMFARLQRAERALQWIAALGPQGLGAVPAIVRYSTTHKPDCPECAYILGRIGPAALELVLREFVPLIESAGPGEESRTAPGRATQQLQTLVQRMAVMDRDGVLGELRRISQSTEEDSIARLAAMILER